MAARKIIDSKEAREKILIGVNRVADTVKKTLGPKGRTVIIDKLYSGPRCTKDGVTVAREIFLEDRFENMGAQLLKQATQKSMDVAGDGTTTSTVLAQKMVQEGIKAVEEGSNPMDLKRGMDLAVEAVVNHLKTHSKPINEDDQVYQIALVSANGDIEIAKTLNAAFKAVGREGQVSLVEGKKLVTEIEIVNGISFRQGFINHGFVNNIQRNTCELEDALLYFYERDLYKGEQIEKLVEEAFKRGKPLLLVANDVKGSAIPYLIHNLKSYTSCAVKAPSYDLLRTELMEDMALLTGAEFIRADAGKRLDIHIHPNMFGEAAKVIVSYDKTTIVGGRGNAQKIQEKKEALQKVLKELNESHEASDEYKNHIKERLLNFNGMAMIRVGGHTELEMKERYDRYDDALHAVKAALSEGISPGGGIALLKALPCLDNIETSNVDMDKGVKIIREALWYPCDQIAENGAVKHVVERILNTYMDTYNIGYNAQNESYGDMIEMGIIDPTKVVRVSLENAASVASMILTTECMITFIESPQMLGGPQTITVPMA